MKRLRYLVLLVIGVAVFVRSGQGCAFSDDDTPSFADPDRPYTDFLQGKLGVVSGQLRVRHLVVAFNTLTGRGLTPGEQKAAVDVDQFYNYNGGSGPEVLSPPFFDASDKTRPALQRWFAMVPESPSATDHSVPGQDYSSFTNCLDDAYAHAAQTLADLRARYGKGGDTPEIKDWIAGQLAVFSNCSDVPPGGIFNPKKEPAPVAAMPQPVSAGAPLWLKQARAYQIAAADFYALRYDKALDEFRAIGADKASPDAALARYVAARVLIRRAVVPYRDDGKPDEVAAANEKVLSGLGEARAALQAIVRDPAMEPYHVPAQHLLDYVMVRLDPTAQSEELARRLTAPKKAGAQDGLDRDYRQNVIDLTYAYNSLPSYSASPSGLKNPEPQIKPTAPLLRWINDVSGLHSADLGTSVSYLLAHEKSFAVQDAATQWQQTKQPQWLVAYLLNAETASAGVAAAMEAAKQTPEASPAWATVTYHRLRLERTATGHARYDEVAALMPRIEATQPRSTINLFADLEAGIAPSLELFLKRATQITAETIQSEPGEGFQAPPAVEANPGSQSEVLCRVPIADPKTPHLDAETAAVFNTRMPLRLLHEASLSSVLPDNARFAVAEMTWTRAVLLNQPEIARALSPYLAQCQPAFQQWLDAYNNAKTDDERQYAGLMALMRFTSVNPVVHPGLERDFATYDYTRDNWWCDANVPYEGAQQAQADAETKAMLFNQPVLPRGLPPGGLPDPPFLTAEDEAEAGRELKALNMVGDAGDYFARGTLAWVKAHPGDPRNADMLGFAMRVVRNSCRSNATKELNHQLFDTLHQKYPKSEWALRYKTWE